MKINLKKKTHVFFIFNVIIIILLIFLSFPLYNFIINFNGYNKIIKLDDNEYVKNSSTAKLKNEFPEIIERKMNIKFVAEVSNNLNWEVISLEDIVELNVGESKIINFKGKNLSNKTIVATANFIAEPKEIIPYLIKTECFCFIEQTLEPGQSQVFSMVFFLDPSLDTDLDLKELKNLTFIYRFSKHIS